MSTPPTAAITAEEFEAIVTRDIGLSSMFEFRVRELGRGLADLEIPFDDRYLRPGGTLSGPTMMTLADTALYAATMSILGPVPLAVTTDLSFHFVRRPPPAAIHCVARILKAGRRLMVGEFHIHTHGEPAGSTGDVVDETLIAFGSGSYSIPPRP